MAATETPSAPSAGPKAGVDLYANGYHVNTGVYDATLTLFLNTPAAGQEEPRSERAGTVRMSLEIMKLLAFYMHRQIVLHEKFYGVRISVPPSLLETGNITAEAWDSFWRIER